MMGISCVVIGRFGLHLNPKDSGFESRLGQRGLTIPIPEQYMRTTALLAIFVFTSVTFLFC